MKNLSDKLSEERRKSHMTQRELADAIGVSQRMIASYEAGVSEPNPAKLKMLAELFDVPGSYLTDDSCDSLPTADREQATLEIQYVLSRVRALLGSRSIDDNSRRTFIAELLRLTAEAIDR